MLVQLLQLSPLYTTVHNLDLLKKPGKNHKIPKRSFMSILLEEQRSNKITSTEAKLGELT